MANRSLKKSQVIAPYGPGAIFDYGNESFVALDISKWDKPSCRRIRLERLEKAMGVRTMLEPPLPRMQMWQQGISQNQSVPYMRFPRWLFCPTCRKMTFWNWHHEQPDRAPVCPHCRPQQRLAPMRFIAVCREGHLTDVDWSRWAHSVTKTRCENPVLSFKIHPELGGGLQSLSVRCETCGSERNFAELISPDAMHRLGISCPGRHPWQEQERAVQCDSHLQVVQRGASNAYFPEVITAIDISADQNGVQDYGHITGHQCWTTLQVMYENEKNPTPDAPGVKAVMDIIVNGVNETAETVWKVLTDNEAAQPYGPVPPVNEANRLLREEWDILTHPPIASQNAPFKATVSDLEAFKALLPKEENASWKLFNSAIDKLVLVTRIRIVKAFSGFRRLDPSANRQMPGMGADLGWVPAVEIFGEGIFISLNHDTLCKWEAKLPAGYANDFTQRHEQSGFDFLPDPTPRFILLHTLSHLLIRQLSFECGYSASSLTERIYCDEDMAGILIYTASSDAEGALGGLVREGRPERFYGIFKTALFRSEWCSNDPICSEMTRQGIHGLNQAACHACTLLPETSCAHINALLDRGTIYGRNTPCLPGFFAEFMSSLNS